MKTIFEFIETVYLRHMSLAAQMIWVESFRQMVVEKHNEIAAKYKAEQVDLKMADGEIDNPEAFSADEIAEAVDMLRADKQRQQELEWAATKTRAMYMPWYANKHR